MLKLTPTAPKRDRVGVRPSQVFSTLVEERETQSRQGLALPNSLHPSPLLTLADRSSVRPPNQGIPDSNHVRSAEGNEEVTRCEVLRGLVPCAQPRAVLHPFLARSVWGWRFIRTNSP